VELERRRLLAVRRFREGLSTDEIAAFLEVTPRSVRRWLAAHEEHGRSAVMAKAAPGRPPKLNHTQEKIVMRWLSGSPLEQGFTTELWTAKRLSQLIHQAWEVSFNHRYLCDWLGQHGYTPQKPQRVPRERDEQIIRGWCRHDWPRIQKKCTRSVATSYSSMKVGY
jgi:transposase